MINVEWKYFFLTTTASLKQFESDRLLLRREEFTPDVNDILLKLRKLRGYESYDLEFMNWMTKDSIKWDMTKEISEETQDHSLQHQSFKYLHSLLRNLFSYYHFFPEHQQYCFIKHGYPIKLRIGLPELPTYILFKEHEEAYETVKITEMNYITQIVQEISKLDLPIDKNNLKVTKDSIILLQYESD